MKTGKSYVPLAAWSLLVLLLIPPLWYSLHTPFALVDDYGDWHILQILGHTSGIIPWLQDTWLHPQNRFRIDFDIYQLVTWALFSDNSAWHHAMRWVLKGVVVWVTFKILRLMVPSGQSAAAMPFFVFCVIYIFFPNNPEARLAPQELFTVVFLALLLYELARLCTRMQGDLALLSLKRYLWLLFVFTAMLWAKEPNVLMGMATLLILVCLKPRRWMHLLPFAVIVILTGIRVWAQFHAGSYGVASVTWKLIQHNIGAYRRFLFLEKTSLLCTFFLGFLSLLGIVRLVIQTCKTRLQLSPVLMFYWFVFLSMLTFYATLLSSWVVLRYFYPLVYLLALWMGLTSLGFGSFSSRGRRVMTTILIISSVYYVGANYYNFVYQFACQYYTRGVEQDLLRATDQLLKDGHRVMVTPGEEYEDKVVIYFNGYLPYYKQTAYRIMAGPSIRPQGNRFYYVTRHKMALPSGHQWYRHFDDSHVSRILWWCDRTSSWFQFGHPAYLWVDAGVAGIGRHGEGIQNWYIYDRGTLP